METFITIVGAIIMLVILGAISGGGNNDSGSGGGKGPVGIDSPFMDSGGIG